MLRSLVTVGLLALWSAASGAGEVSVSGRVVMPDACSPAASPAVVTLTAVGGGASVGGPSPGAPAQVALVNQHGLQFEPRVQVARLGQPIQFANQDAEPHNVHVLAPGVSFDRSMAPREASSLRNQFVPDKPGLIRVVCNIHGHMRGYVVVAATPWAQVVKGGAFRFAGVPEGRYLLDAWHEMGDPIREEVEVKGDDVVDLGTITLKGPAVVARQSGQAAPARPWDEVTDRVGVLLSEARAVVRKPDGVKKARSLAETAYWGEFEGSDMEVAVRRHLGYQRAGAIEVQFRGIRSAIKAVGSGEAGPEQLVTRSGKLLIDLHRASADLKRLKVNDRADVGRAAEHAEVVATPDSSEQAGQLRALAASFAAIQGMADQGQSGDAASAMTEAYFADFEPLERLLNVRRPREVAPLEARFAAIRGRVDSGARGDELRADLAGLVAEVAAATERCRAATAGTFGPAFAASLVTILREGVEVILLLTMLVALVAKAGNPRGLAAIRWGVGAAVGASALTAVALNLVVASAQGRTREVVEGSVMMAAAGVLFYVSYWLVSQSQAKRWSEFLKGQVARGARVGGLGTLAATAFLAVYREGAETTLMYQAMIGGQGGTRAGLLGLAAGLAVGVVILAAVAVLIRRSSVRLPLRSFFKVTGLVLFAMAVIFAGNGVFELQGAGIIKITPVGWLGLGVPALGLHPSVQALSVQGILLAGALLALVPPAFEGRTRPAPAPAKVAPPAAGVGV